MPDPTHSSALLGAAVTVGNLAVWLGLISSLGCLAYYWAAMLRTMKHPATAEAAVGGRRSVSAAQGDPQAERLGLLARRWFFINAAFVLIGSAALATLILTQQYNVAYVHKNTNSILPIGYRIASFWSDQEGTFFLWSFYNVVLGSLVIRRAREDERWVMPFFVFVNVSLFALLTFMNPFWLTPAKEVREGLLGVGVQADQLGWLPTTAQQHFAYYFGWAKYLNPHFLDGRGLNEQLQNPWMVIHPPTLFVGYSSMMIPACFAVGALMRRDYDSWVNRAAPWLMFSWSVLGFGIFLGAYWAYETLGWGGYWSWDPVENSSIIPWLVGTALLHGLLAQRNRGNLKQANLFLGIMAGVAVLLGSFLVRSGVLSENSVHSFATPQKSVFYTLLGSLLIWSSVAIGIWFKRYREIESEIAYETTWERHFGFFLGLIILSAATIIVVLGVFVLPVLVPAIVKPLGIKTTNPDFTFYNKALLPIAYVLMLLMALTPLMPWKRAREENKPLKPFNQVMLGLAALFTVYFLGAAAWAAMGGFTRQNDPAYIAFGLIGGLALVTNLVCMVRAAKGGFLRTGPWLAHIGFIVFLAGVVITSRFNTTQSVVKLDLNDSETIRGIKYTFVGQRPAATPGDRDRMLIDMQYPDGTVVHLDPKLFKSKQNGQTMAWPQIIHQGLNDLYIEPNGVDTSGVISLDDVRRDAPEPVAAMIQHRRTDPQDRIDLAFAGLDTSQMQAAMQAGERKPFTVFANLVLTIRHLDADGIPVSENTKAVKAALKLTQDEHGLHADGIPLRLEGLRQKTGYSLIFKDTNMTPGDLKATFEIVPDEPVNQGYFQVLSVPGIQVLWWGVYVMVFGGLLCFVQRRKLAGRSTPPPAPRGGRSADVPREETTKTEPVRELAGARLRSLRKPEQAAE